MYIWDRGQKMDHKRKEVVVDEKLKKRALRYYHRCRDMAKTLRKPLLLKKRVLHLAKKRGQRTRQEWEAGRATAEAKAEIVARIAEGHEPIVDVSIETGYSRAAPCKWLRQYRTNGIIGLTGKEIQRVARLQKHDG